MLIIMAMNLIEMSFAMSIFLSGGTLYGEKSFLGCLNFFEAFFKVREGINTEN